MDDAAVEEKLRELVKEFGGADEFQQIKLAILAKQAQETAQELKKEVNTLQEAIDFLRICIKYQLFDLEATRRENEYLKKLLEEKNS
jgi:uncharacterized protein YlxW (UPF0749 family)